MLPDRVSNPEPLTYESGALPIALRGPACSYGDILVIIPILSLLPHLIRSSQPQNHFLCIKVDDINHIYSTKFLSEKTVWWQKNLFWRQT